MADIEPANLLPDDDAGTTPAAEADAGPPAFATLVSTDGRLIRLSPQPGGEVSIRVHGGKVPLLLDRWQAMALRQAVASLPEG